jgi:hypothetical protein
MRNPKRIKPLLKLIETIWLKYPDFRLCQLMGSCLPMPDGLYWVEDDLLEGRLRTLYKSLLGEDNATSSS